MNKQEGKLTPKEIKELLERLELKEKYPAPDSQDNQP